MKKEIVYFAQILISAILIFLILIQKRGSALSAGEFYPLRRGMEKKIFLLTIFFIVVFVGLALINLIIK